GGLPAPPNPPGAAAGLPGADRRRADAGLPGRASHPRGGRGAGRLLPTHHQPAKRGGHLVPRPPRALPWQTRARFAPGSWLRRVRAPARGPARPDRRGAALPAPARPGRGPGDGHRLPGRRPGARAAGPGEPGAAVPRSRGRQRPGPAGRARPAGVRGRGPADRSAADRRLRQAAVPPGRAADALLPGRRDAGRRRPGHAADAAQPGPGADRPGRGAGRRRGLARPGRRPGPYRGRPAGAARHRAVDRLLHQDAGALRPGRVPADRRGRAGGADPPGGGTGWYRARGAVAGGQGRGGAGRRLAAMALLRRPSPVGFPRRRKGSIMTSPFVAPGRDAPQLYHIVRSPIGRLLLLGDGHALTGLWMIDAERHTSRVVDGLTPDPGSFRAVESQLEAYFAGDLKEFTVPLAPSGTPFQLAVWTELTKIPYGSTITYGDIALALGKRLVASRAVGLANGSNPISVIVPCHRVIGSDGSLTGYGGGLERKELLLRLEGAGPVTLF